VNLSVTFREDSVTPGELIGNVTLNHTLPFGAVPTDPHGDDPLHYYFTPVPEGMLGDVTPYSALFASEEDRAARAMFLWISSAGVRMHSHFDQDHNVFVQLSGHKHFVLVPPEQWRLMHPFPRVHPLWHKSQADVDAPQVDLLRLYPQVAPLEAQVGPGDVLYLPPLWWHAVESQSGSVSLSVLSHDQGVRQVMHAIYKHEHKVDLLADTSGRRFALRLYLDLLVNDMVGANATTAWMAQLVLERYRGVADLFRRDDDTDGEPLCPPDKVPTAVHVYGDAKLDQTLVGASFAALASTTLGTSSWRAAREMLLVEYVEKLAAAVVGTNNLLAFMMDCFQGQGYRVTDKDSEEHERLWRSR